MAPYGSYVGRAVLFPHARLQREPEGRYAVLSPGTGISFINDAGDGKPDLALLGYDAVEVAGDNVIVPDLVGCICRKKGASGDLRLNRNNLVLLLADQACKEEMKLLLINPKA